MSDFNPPKPKAGGRVLLLAPPGLSSHPELLNTIVTAHDRDVTNIHMLDRLAEGLVDLPGSTYDTVLILTDPDGTRTESSKLVGRDMMAKIVHSLKVGGKLRSQDQTFGKDVNGAERREAILAGLVWEDSEELTKPDQSSIQSVPLRFGKKKALGTPSASIPSVSESNGVQPLSTSSGNGAGGEEATKAPTGVGFIDFSDDLGADPNDEDDELIDEETLLGEADLARPIIQPAACRPKAGKRRRACKDCTCGLKEKIEAEDSKKRADADQALSTMKLGADDLAEVDFTVQGKVGSCGNCALGDAFRCDGCPYIGLPAFKPGEEVRLLNDEAQL